MPDGLVIIIEGTDKCGKTTLANSLSEMLSIPIKKFSQPGPRGAFNEYMDAIKDTEGPFIADRFHLGESVYGPIYRDTLGLSTIEFRGIEAELDDRGAFLILMEDFAHEIIARFKLHNEDFAREADIPNILRGFDREFYRSRLEKTRLVWDDKLAPIVASLLIRKINRRKDLVA